MSKTYKYKGVISKTIGIDGRKEIAGVKHRGFKMVFNEDGEFTLDEKVAKKFESTTEELHKKVTGSVLWKSGQIKLA